MWFSGYDRRATQDEYAAASESTPTSYDIWGIYLKASIPSTRSTDMSSHRNDARYCLSLV